MPTIAELGFAVHSEPIDQAADSLDNLVDAGARAENAVESLGAASEKAGKSVSGGAKESVKGIEAQGAAAEKAKNSTGQFTEGLDRVGVSAKQTAAALRLVPAQITDIVVGLQGGQAPLTVLLQQGGQLKDMFGGLGPATKALGGYIVGLVNPFTVAAAAAAGLGAAYYAGTKESEAFNQALIFTGNYAGTSSGQLAALAQSIGATVGNTGAAADALTSLASSGKLAGENFGLITESALLMKEITGRAVEDTIAEFAKIAEDPVAAAKTLNEQYHFLTQSAYSQIAALKEQGDTAGAAKILTEQYAEVIKSRSGEMTQNLNAVERAWLKIKNASLGAIDATLSIGREKTLEEQRATAQEKLNDLEKKSQNILVSRSESVQRERVALQAQLNILDLQIDGERTRTQYLGNQAQLHQQAITATQKVDAITKSTADNEKKRNDEIKEYKGLLESIRKDNPNDARLDSATVEKTIQGIRDKYKDAKGITAPVDLTSFNAAENALKSLETTFQNSLKVLDAAQKAGLISDQEYALQKGALLEKEKSDVQAAYQSEISALEAVSAKSSTTGAQRVGIDQKIADARSKMVDSLKKLDADQEVLSIQTQERLDKERQAIDAYAQALQDSLKRTQDSLDLQLAGFGMGDQARQQLQEMLKIRQDYEDKFDKLERDHRLKRISDNEYDADTKLLQESLGQRITMQQGYYDKEAALRSDWMNGASRAFANYIDETKDIAGQTEGLFSDALHGVEDAFVDAATTGKLSFKDLADSIIADLARIVAKAYVVTPILAALGIGGSSAAGAGSAGGLGSVFSSSGSGITGMLSSVKDVVSVAGSKFGQSVMQGWSSGEGVAGGLQGAFENGAGYVKDAITSAFTSGSASAAATFTSETSSAALTQSYANYAAQFGTGVSQGSYTAASSAVSQSALSSSLANLSVALSYIQGVYTIFQSFESYGLKGAAVTGGAAAAGAMIGSYIMPGIGTAIGFAVGAVAGAFGANAWFGSGEKYPDLSTSATGSYINGQYNDSGIAKGWQTKAPKYGSAADAQMSSTLQQFSTTLGNLYEVLGNGADVVGYSTLQQRKTSGKYSSTFGAQLDDGSVITAKQQFKAADIAAAMTADYDDIMGTFLAKAIVSSKSLPDYFKAQFTEFANDWNTTADEVIKAIEGVFTRFNGVNDALSLINVQNLKLDNTGLMASDSILNMIGAMSDLDTTTATAKEKVDALNTAVGTYYQAFFSADEQFADLTDSLKGAFAGFGLELPDTRSAYRDMVEDIDVTTAAGQAMFATLVGLAQNADSYYSTLDQKAQAAAEAAQQAAEAALSAWSNYYDLFATDTQKATDTLAGATAQFAALGLAMPSSRDGFVAMVSAIDQTTAAGKAMFSSLLGLATSADAAYDIIEANAAASSQALMTGASNAFSALQRAITAQQTKITDAYNARTSSLNDMLDTANTNVSDLTGVSSDLSSALKALRGDSDDAVKMLRAQAQATLQSALATARAGGSLSDFAGLDDALDTIGNNSTDLYSSLEDFNRDQGRTAGVIAELEATNGKQLTSAEKSAKALQEQLDQAKKTYDAQMSQFDSQLAFAQSQLDALNGVDTSVLSVADAVNRMNAAVVAALSGQAAGAATKNTYDNNVALLESVYQMVLGRSLDPTGKATWTAALANGTVTYDDLVKTIATGGKLNGETVKIPGYASGGDFGGGLRLVGENGPELEVTGPSRIYNANQTAAMLNGGGSNADVVAELRALRAELESIKANTQSGAVNGSKLVRMVDRVTEGGNAMLTKELA